MGDSSHLGHQSPDGAVCQTVSREGTARVRARASWHELSAASDAWTAWSIGVLDIAVVFPSLSMEWLWDLFDAMQSPEQLARALRVMYTNLSASFLLSTIVGPPILSSAACGKVVRPAARFGHCNHMPCLCKFKLLSPSRDMRIRRRHGVGCSLPSPGHFGGGSRALLASCGGSCACGGAGTTLGADVERLRRWLAPHCLAHRSGQPVVTLASPLGCKLPG